MRNLSPVVSLRAAVALAGAVLVLTGCSRSKRAPAFVAPVQQEVPADRITLTGTAPENTVMVMAGVVTAALEPDRKFWARNVPLVPGENLIAVVATDATGRELRRETVRVVATTGPDPAVVLLDPPSGPPPLTVQLRVASPHDVVEVLFDFDGDGTVESAAPLAGAEHVYAAAGRYAPQATIRTRAGLYFSSLLATPIAQDPMVLVLPEPTVARTAAVDTPERALLAPDGRLMVLSRRAREVVILSADLATRARVALRGVDDPSGLALDAAGRFLTCDAAQHRVVRLTRTGALDLTFNFQGFVGAPGAGPLQFQRPSDVALDDEQNIYVADAGNRRIQKLNQEGVFVAQFALAGEPTRLAYQNGGVHYALAGSDQLAVLDILGVERRRFAAAGRGAVRSIAVLADRGVVATATDGEPTIWLQGLNGRGRRALRVPDVTAVQHVVLSPRADQLELLVLDAGGRVLAVAVPEDDAAATADQVVVAMLQRLGAGDLEGALLLFDAEARAAYRRQFTAMSPAQRAALLATVQVGAVVAQNEHHAEVAIAAAIGGRSQEDVVGLGRDARTFAWRITSF